MRTTSDITFRSNIGFAVAAIRPESKPMRLSYGWYICKVCNEKCTYITKDHAKSHGFNNVKEMIAAGKAIRR